MGRRHPERKPARSAQKRAPKPRLLVVTEGEVTEPEYLRGLARQVRAAVVELEIADSRGVPLTLVTIARDLWKAARSRAKREKDAFLDYDAVWCVFDKDDHPNFDQAVDMARQNEIELAISNPCFELWLLLHFRESPGAQHRHLIQRKMKEFVVDYEKRVDFERFRDGVANAVARAERLEVDAVEMDEAFRNPTTGVYRLVRSLWGGEA